MSVTVSLSDYQYLWEQFKGALIERDAARVALRQAADDAIDARLARAGAPAAPDVDELAQFIRSVNGDRSLGAGQLASEICEWLADTPAPSKGVES